MALPKRSTAASNTYAAPPSDSETSPTTSPEHSSKQEDSDPNYTLNYEEPVMVNYTVSILRHSLGLPVLGVPTKADELPSGWVLQETPAWSYVALDGPDGEHLDFEASGARYCVSLAWLYDVTPSELLNAYMLPDGGPLLRQWLGYPYLR